VKWSLIFIFSAIEYAINSLESNEARRRCDHLATQREDFNNRQNQAETEMMEVQEEIQTVGNRIRKLEARFKVYRDETDRVINEKTELMEKKKSVELSIKDLQEDIGQERNSRGTAEEALRSLHEEISQKSEELDQLLPNFIDLVEKEKQIQTDISINEQKCKELNAKLGRHDQFKNVQERDAYLNREINTTNKQIRETNAQIGDIERSITDDSAEIDQLQQQAQVST
jgi:structural maintenance of chromosome 3 (chondroitin sulfate proteoglycan 6)